MEPIRSGPTAERVVRAAGLAMLVSVFAVWFLWDGHRGYARKNSRELVRSLGRDDAAVPPIDPKLTTAEAHRRLVETPQGSRRAELERVWGPPAIEHRGETYYLGPGGHARIQWNADRMTTAEWVKARHTETDQLIQRWLGVGLGILAAFYLVYLARVATTRVLLTDAGLRYRGRTTIPWEAIKALRPYESGRGSGIEIEHEMAGRSCLLRLDTYHVRSLSTIITAICQRKGFEIPLGMESPAADPADPSLGT